MELTGHREAGTVIFDINGENQFPMRIADVVHFFIAFFGQEVLYLHF